jgi:type II secretory ATPase GspE/PulE/Tfp pilus assembly ATPase PilB-like protein
MVAGTFNLVIAQRLARKNCSKCSVPFDVKDDYRWQHAKKAFMNFDKDRLKKEIESRNITKEQWLAFFTE